MHFCYLHKLREAQGQCSYCNHWICSEDYRMVEEKIGEQRLSQSGFGRRNSRGFSGNLNIFAPIIICPECYDGTENVVEKRDDQKNSSVVKKKVNMCFQCGALITVEDNFCPNCGESTADEIKASSNPLEGVRSSKRLK